MEVREKLQELEAGLDLSGGRPRPSYSEMARWLEAAGGDTDRALANIRANSDWRQTGRLDTFLHWKPPEVLSLYVPGGLSGFDIEDHFIVIHTEKQPHNFYSIYQDVSDLKFNESSGFSCLVDPTGQGGREGPLGGGGQAADHQLRAEDPRDLRGHPQENVRTNKTEQAQLRVRHGGTVFDCKILFAN